MCYLFFTYNILYISTISPLKHSYLGIHNARLTFGPNSVKNKKCCCRDALSTFLKSIVEIVKCTLSTVWETNDSLNKAITNHHIKVDDIRKEMKGRE